MKDNDLISAKVIEFTESPLGDKLITLELTAPKFLDAEFEKHRMTSSNSSSSRAIPFNRSLDTDIFLPIDIRKNERGMQGYSTFDEIDSITIRAMFLEIYDYTINRLKDINKIFNPHKQHLNRYLEPFTIQRKIATANIEWWDYFLMLRKGTDADPAIQDLAVKIEDAIDSAKPKFSTWHMPYVEAEECKLDIEDQLAHSVARCARVSYNNFNGTKSTLEQDKKLYKFLIEAYHLTPFEHQAIIMLEININSYEDFYTAIANIPKGITHVDIDGYYHSGNFKGFIQNRQRI